MGIFDALHIGYSGLSTSQSGINTTSHNISNVNTTGYSRQRVEQKANYPLDIEPGMVGTGVKVEEIVRQHDEFVYGRFKSANASLAQSEFSESTLQEVSDLFTDLDGKGIADDLKAFFDSWSNLTKYPDDDAAKLVTVDSMDRMAGDLRSLRGDITKVQDRLNDELVDSVDQINSLSKQIVALNKQINKVENVPHQHANDLRDERDRLELDLAKMVNISVYKGNVDINGKATQTDAGNAYNINIAGHNIVDGVTFHPLEIAPANDRTKFHGVYYTDHNQQKTDVTDKLRGGKIGALIDLRGDGYEGGKAVHSKLQNYVDKLDAFAKRLIEQSNSIYASSAQERLQSDPLKDITTETKLSEVDDLKAGSFDLVVYDSSGNEVLRRGITIDDETTLDGSADSASIVKQINANSDDNGNNDGTDDLDDLFAAEAVVDPLSGIPSLSVIPKDSNPGYTIAIEDNGTNFGGWSGVNRLFEGESAKDIRLKESIVNNPASLDASKAHVSGSADLAEEMLNMQYAQLDFKNPDGSTTTQTLEEFYRYTAGDVAADAQNATRSKDAAELLTKTVTEQMQSVSGVDMDEELMNLMKYQTAYQASAKIITTVDEMMTTLLGIKQ